MLLSVVVTIVDAGDALMRCLDALTAQRGAPPLEVLVPYDDSVPGMRAFVDRFPAFQFLDLGALQTAELPSDPAGQHELFDRRRAAGLSRARGDLVAILEDRGVPRPNWAAEATRLHAERPGLVIGGAIENGCDRLLNWAVYFCDFGRYQRPFQAGPRQYVSDVNVVYKRAALDLTRALWQTRYHEPVVHDALQRAGEALMLSPDFVVDQFRDHLRLSSVLRERIAWGRLFASLRVREERLRTRLGFMAISPLLPVLLFVRLARMQLDKRVSLSRFVSAAPVVALLLVGWCAGEFLGYLTGAAVRAKSDALPRHASGG
jgi:hypothetical protein